LLLDNYHTLPPVVMLTAQWLLAYLYEHFMQVLRDNHGRVINYLRLAVTDRCNLRCFYCMPEHGLQWLAREELLTWEEMLQLCRLVVSMGVEKIRITGGEPFARKDLLPFLAELVKVPGLQQVSITTNGVLTADHVPELRRLGIHAVNLSLDTLDRERFRNITHRDDFDNVMRTLEALLAEGIETKVNAVVMEQKNIDDILPLVELTRDRPVSVRFIEEMPFNGVGSHYPVLNWDHLRILQHIREAFPAIEKVADPAYSTAYNYHIPGHKGTVGIIAAYTRSFCGTCNRIRLTPQGTLKTCLYEAGGTNIKALLRGGATDNELKLAIADAVAHKAKDGLQAEQETYGSGIHESMAEIGG